MICCLCKNEIPDRSAFCMFCGAQQSDAPIRRPNGSGTIRKRGSRWECIVTLFDPIRHQHSKTFKTKSEAMRAAPRLLAELHTMEKAAPIRKTATVGQLYQIWKDASAPKLSESKQTAYRAAWSRIEKLKNRPIDSLGLEDLQQLVAGLTYYPARDVKSLLSHIYKRACAQQDVQSNLAQFIELPNLEESEAVPFSQDEVQHMWSIWDSGDNFAGYLLLMIYTGMMPGELLNATIDMIDWDHQQIVGAGLKTKERRTKPIMIPAIIVPVLRRICENVTEDHKLVQDQRNYFYERYHKWLTANGIRDLPMYSCRHTTASMLALNTDIAPMLITKAMRQSRPLTTERYKHADADQVLGALDQLAKNYVQTTDSPPKITKTPVNTGVVSQEPSPAKGVGWGDWREGSNPSFSAKDRE